MKNSVVFGLIKLINRAKLSETLKTFFEGFSKLNKEKDNIYLTIRIKNSKIIDKFNKENSDLEKEELQLRQSEFFNSLIDEKSKEKIQLVDSKLVDLKFDALSTAFEILDKNEEEFLKFIALYKKVDVEDVKEGELEIIVDVVKEIMNDKSFLSLMELFNK